MLWSRIRDHAKLQIDYDHAAFLLVGVIIDDIQLHLAMIADTVIAADVQLRSRICDQDTDRPWCYWK